MRGAERASRAKAAYTARTPMTKHPLVAVVAASLFGALLLAASAHAFASALPASSQ